MKPVPLGTTLNGIEYKYSLIVFNDIAQRPEQQERKICDNEK